MIGYSAVAAGIAGDDGSTVWASRDGGPSRIIYQHKQDACVGAMSRDQELLPISHSEHGDPRHPAIQVAREADGRPVAEKRGEGHGLQPLKFSPPAGDQRLLLTHERRDRVELPTWDITAGTETELVLDLPGTVTPHQVRVLRPDGTDHILLTPPGAG